MVLPEVMADWTQDQSLNLRPPIGWYESSQPGNTNKLILICPAHPAHDLTETHGHPLRLELSSCPFHRCRIRVIKVKQLAQHQGLARSVRI